MEKRIIKPIGRILVLVLLVLIAVASFVIAFPLFCMYLYLWHIADIYMLDFAFVSFVLIAIPATCIYLIRYLLKQYNVI